METHHFEETITSDKGKLIVLVEVGRIDIHPHADSTIVIDAETRHMDLTVTREGDIIHVRAEKDEAWSEKLTSFFFNNHPRADLTIHVPTNCEVQAKTITGTLSVSGVDAPVTTRVTTGKTHLENLGGPIYAKTVTGSMAYRGLLVNDNHRFEATTGNIHLRLTREPDARLDMSAVTGDVRCDFPITQKVQARNLTGKKVSGVLGSGTGSIKAKVVTGSLRLESL